MNAEPKSHFDYENGQFWFDQVDKLQTVKKIYNKLFG